MLKSQQLVEIMGKDTLNISVHHSFPAQFESADWWGLNLSVQNVSDRISEVRCDFDESNMTNFCITYDSVEHKLSNPAGDE